MAKYKVFLGGMKPQMLKNNEDMNTVLTTGIYYNTSGKVVNGSTSVGLWIVFAAQLSTTIHALIQIACDPRAKGAYPLKYRVAWTDSGNGWSDWKALATT